MEAVARMEPIHWVMIVGAALVVVCWPLIGGAFASLRGGHALDSLLLAAVERRPHLLDNLMSRYAPPPSPIAEHSASERAEQAPNVQPEQAPNSPVLDVIAIKRRGMLEALVRLWEAKIITSESAPLEAVFDVSRGNNKAFIAVRDALRAELEARGLRELAQEQAAGASYDPSRVLLVNRGTSREYAIDKETGEPIPT